MPDQVQEGFVSFSGSDVIKRPWSLLQSAIAAAGDAGALIGAPDRVRVARTWQPDFPSFPLAAIDKEANMNHAVETQGLDASAGALEAPRMLTELEGRVLASLYEKAQTTPDQYPLTVNALQLACNQKNNRDPISQHEQGAIVHALRDLENRGWARQSSEGVRAQRWEHRFDHHLGLTPRKAAVLCTLLLRGPQTLNEIHTRSERLTPFPSVDDVEDALERLAERTPALVVKLPRQPGQREERYMHLLFGAVDAALLADRAPSERATRAGSGLEARIEALEAEVAELRAALISLGALPD